MASIVKTRDSPASLMQSIGFQPSVLQSALNRNALEAVGDQTGCIHRHKGGRDPMPGLKPLVLLEHSQAGKSCVLPEVPFPPNLRSWLPSFFFRESRDSGMNRAAISMLPLLTLQLWAKFHICCLKLLKWTWAWQWAMKIFSLSRVKVSLTCRTLRITKHRRDKNNQKNGSCCIKKVVLLHLDLILQLLTLEITAGIEKT